MLRTPAAWIALLAALAAPLGACGGDAGTTTGPDGGTDGAPPVDAPPPPTWAFADVHGVPNLDDDDGAQVDWAQPLFATDDDLAPLVLPAAVLGLVPAGGDVELRLTGDVASVRIFQGDLHVLGAEAGAGPVALPPPAGADLPLRVELGAYGARAELALAARDGAGAVAHATTVVLQASPLILNHHLQRAERVWAVQVPGNEAMIADLGEALGAAFVAVPGAQVSGDVWMQDEFEHATLTGGVTAVAQRVDVVVDSIRNRGLAAYADDLTRTAAGDAYAQTWGNPTARTTYDSFGNLEASPPVTVGGVPYPFGRIYYGRTGTAGLNTTLGDFLAAQRVQAPFTLPTNWLCVGHVDEVVSFVPDPAAPKGFRLLVTDTALAWQVLEGLPPSTPLPLYGRDHGYDTVGELLGDASLRALNDDLQVDRLEPILATMKTELGLDDGDVVRVPGLFEQIGNCGGRVAALIPGMVNLTVASVDGATTHVFTADPFFRATTDQSTDPVIAAFRAALPPSLALHFVDDWEVYHLALGEVHCATNVRRTPAATWWTAAQHLLGGL